MRVGTHCALRDAKVGMLHPVGIRIEGLEGVGPVQGDEAKLAILVGFLSLG